LHVAQLREYEAEFKTLGAGLAVVGLSDRAHACEFRGETGIAFPLLVDDEQRAYRAIDLKKGNIFHLLSPANFAARRRAKAAGLKQHRMGKDPFQLGGSFVFGPGNVDIYSHVSTTFGDNAPVAAMLAAIRSHAAR
jgi:AhpC/TSA antioxidant enzyme